MLLPVRDAIQLEHAVWSHSESQTLGTRSQFSVTESIARVARTARQFAQKGTETLGVMGRLSVISMVITS